MKRKQNVWIKVPEVHQDIIRRLSQGHTAQEIAEQRERSYNTVRTQIAYMIGRYSCKNATQLVAEFMRKGIIK